MTFKITATIPGQTEPKEATINAGELEQHVLAFPVGSRITVARENGEIVLQIQIVEAELPTPETKTAEPTDEETPEQ